MTPGGCMKMGRYGWLAAILLSLVACERVEQLKAKRVEDRRAECLDKICEGDVLPKYDTMRYAIFKRGGQLFLAPREYGGASGSLAFLWPSKTPARKEGAPNDAPEFIPSRAGQNSNFYDVGIEIHLRSTSFPTEPHGYRLIEVAQAKDWIADRVTLREGLDRVRMKSAPGPEGRRIDYVTYYVATSLKGPDGLPPVGVCNHDDPRNGGGGGFMWRDGVFAGISMNQKHCEDWPEIYTEVVRVLQLIKKV